MMKLEIKNNQFIDINDLIKTNKLNCSVENYNYENKLLKGEFLIQGEYINDSSCFDEPFNFFKKVPFEIMFIEDVIDLDDVEIKELEYFEVERRGIEIEITLVLTYNNNRSENIENVTEEIYEEIKNDASTSVDEILNNTLLEQKVSTNTFPSNERKTRIKLF